MTVPPPVISRAAFVLAGCLAFACHDAVSVQTATATRRSLVVPILADGSLEPATGGEIRSPEGGVVSRILASEGQRVVPGVELLRLENASVTERVLAGRAEAVQVAEEQRRNRTERATLELERDHLRALVDADGRLFNAGAITGQQRATDSWNYRQSETKIHEAEAQAADISTRARIAADSLRELERRLSNLVIRASREGIVYNLPRGIGESVAPGQLVATVADPLHLRVRTRVEAPDLPRVRTGQRVIVTFDGLPGQRWDGTVVEVPPGLRETNGREVGEVMSEIRGDARVLPANASVNVEIIVGEKASALLIPRGALLRDGNSRYVYGLANGKARRTIISIGLIGPADAEVTQGLREGDQVIVPGAAPIHDGQPVVATPS